MLRTVSDQQLAAFESQGLREAVDAATWSDPLTPQWECYVRGLVGLWLVPEQGLSQPDHGLLMGMKKGHLIKSSEMLQKAGLRSSEAEQVVMLLLAPADAFKMIAVPTEQLHAVREGLFRDAMAALDRDLPGVSKRLRQARNVSNLGCVLGAASAAVLAWVLHWPLRWPLWSSLAVACLAGMLLAAFIGAVYDLRKGGQPMQMNR